MKYKVICFSLLTFLFLNVQAFAQGASLMPKDLTGQYKDNFLKICAELSNGETDFKEYIGRKISFNYYPLDLSKYKNGPVTINSFLFSSPTAGSYGTKVLILNPTQQIFCPPDVNGSSMTGMVKAVDVAQKIIIIDQANVCFRDYSGIRA